MGISLTLCTWLQSSYGDIDSLLKRRVTSKDWRGEGRGGEGRGGEGRGGEGEGR